MMPAEDGYGSGLPESVPFHVLISFHAGIFGRYEF